MAIDTLAYVKALEAAGVERHVAEAHAEALAKFAFPDLATTAELNREIAAVRSDLRELEQRLTARLTFLQWQIGLAIAAEVVIGAPELWLLLRVAAKVGALG